MLYGFSLWLAPLVAQVSGLAAVLSLLMLIVGKWVVKGSVTSILYGTGLPTCVAAYAWRGAGLYSRALYLFWPFLAFALFALKVGFTAHLWFAAYWLIIPTLYLGFERFFSHVLVRAIATSLIAHSVGSLIVLYAGASVGWSSLVVVVPFERMIAALGMLACHALMRGFSWLCDAVRREWAAGFAKRDAA